MTLNQQQLDQFHASGHLTVPAMFSLTLMQTAIDDAQAWAERSLAAMDQEQRAWYLERDSGVPLPRKIDNPVFHREVFRSLATDPALVGAVQQIIGRGVNVFFSQVFFKPPQHGGPKPVHQDNYYFGPDRGDAMLTAWIALDEATVENGCLFYGDGSQQEGILPHTAPPDEPFNLQVPAETASKFSMTPAPVPAGGVSFHHGLTLHQSSHNTSDRWRRAVAIHYLQNDVRLTSPRLPYDESVAVKVT